MKLIALVFLFVVSAIAKDVAPPKRGLLKAEKAGKAKSRKKRTEVAAAAEKAITSSKKQESKTAFWKKGWTLARPWLPVACKVGLIALLIVQEWISQKGPDIMVGRDVNISPAAEIVKDSVDALVAARKQVEGVAPIALRGHQPSAVVDENTLASAEFLGKQLLRDVVALTGLSKVDNQLSALTAWAASFYNEVLQSLNGVGEGISEVVSSRLEELDSMKMTGEDNIELFSSALKKKYADQEGVDFETLLQKSEVAPSNKLMDSFADRMWAMSVPLRFDDDAPGLDYAHAALSGSITWFENEVRDLRSHPVNAYMEVANFFEENYVKILVKLRKSIEYFQMELVADAQFPWKRSLHETILVAQQDLINLHQTPLGYRLRSLSYGMYVALQKVADFYLNSASVEKVDPTLVSQLSVLSK